MHLKSMTLRGFKSFASATSLRFEPGITCVVGPNGSGKSNVVDALAWVMGEQGAKSLRGGKMEDVIFAGTAGRPPLGRAEVSLTIDNTDGALPIDYSEVTISRTMFRSGGSEYAINGSACRLLDVQELLSDSGIGREMHVIVGQGRLDAVLHASPEERRGFIEEAAGVLKHRKRKEKALRKLEAMQANLTRLADLTAEIRRQLKPLGRQAEVARRAAVVQADLRDARARLLADDLVQFTAALEQEVADETALRARREEVEAELADARHRLADLERDAADAAPRLARAQETWYRLSSLRERVRGTASLAADRRRLLGEEAPERTPGRDPEELEAQARAIGEQEEALAAEVEFAREHLAEAVEARHDAERAEGEEERRLNSLVRAAADRREGLARLAGQVAARRSRLDTALEQSERLAQQITEAEARADAAAQEFSAVEGQVAGVEAGEEGLDAEHEAAAADLHEAHSALEAAKQTERDAERDRATWSARREALELGLQRKDGSGTLLAAGDRLSGLLGSVAALVQVRPGYENAVSAALGTAADAVVTDSLDGALAAVRLLQAEDGGQAGVLVGHAPSGPATAGTQEVPAPGCRWARDLITAPDHLGAALDRLLDGVLVAPELDVAREVIARRPELTVVTLHGDLVSAAFVRGGSRAAASSLLEVQAAVDEAAERVAVAVRAGEQARFALHAAQSRYDTAQLRVESALDALHDSDARLAAVAERLGQLGSTARAARAEADRLRTAKEAGEAALEADREALHELEERLRVAEEHAEVDAEEPSTAARDTLAAASTAARATEMEARLALRTAEERARALSGRAEQLLAAAAAEREARARAVAREQRRRRQLVTAEAVLAGAHFTLGVLESSLLRAEQVRAAADAERRRFEAELGSVRGRVAHLAEELARLTDVVHKDEVARAEQRMRIDALRERCVDELGLDPQILVEEYGPHLPVPPPPLAPGESEPEGGREATPFVRAVQEKRLRAAERALALLGTVNPLALEEFAALEERHRFLTTQLEDLKASRKDLLDIVKEVDERVEQVFTEAFHDTAREFEGVFARLFPGGEGRLILTDPSDMLATGLDVEARPPGKKVKRLSLLSGGERSLTAVALLVAIFKARPSPFYVLDEVEAALDDTNLGRLITLMEELRGTSQLIVVTHQKRTMEIADALYGVTMRGDGVTTVISQRLREDQPA
ncbi:MAG: chromosome segregation protein SMC [Kineosporiaceae bacterium]|nr:chromosome segregation protein SMC [Kineosporiaceae bacterium]